LEPVRLELESPVPGLQVLGLQVLVLPEQRPQQSLVPGQFLGD
jgi:hypothetical protein